MLGGCRGRDGNVMRTKRAFSRQVTTSGGRLLERWGCVFADVSQLRGGCASAMVGYVMKESRWCSCVLGISSKSKLKC